MAETLTNPFQVLTPSEQVSDVARLLSQQPRIAVDTHVFRVSNRTGIVQAKTTDLTQLQLERIVPKKWLLKAHHLFILHGRYVCKSQKPLCKQCSIFHLCEYKDKKIYYNN